MCSISRFEGPKEDLLSKQLQHQFNVSPDYSLQQLAFSHFENNSPADFSFNEEEHTQHSVDLVWSETKKAKTKRAVLQLTDLEKSNLSKDDFTNKLLNQTLQSAATYWGINLLEETRWLGWDESKTHHVLYQKTGASLITSARHFMIAFSKVPCEDDNKAKITWRLLNNYDQDSRHFTGPWAKRLLDAGHYTDPNAEWTPYNAGSWELDLENGTITYTNILDMGGRSNYSPDEAVLKIPNQIVNELFGITSTFEMAE